MFTASIAVQLPSIVCHQVLGSKVRFADNPYDW
jgi:hypothetical protein